MNMMTPTPTAALTPMLTRVRRWVENLGTVEVETPMPGFGRTGDVHAASDAMTRESQVLSGIVDRLEKQLDECLSLIERSRHSAQGYGTALASHAEEIDADAPPVVARLVELTRAAVDTARRIEDEANHAKRQTKQLRTSLKNARRDAERDHLTGLPNRRAFDQRLGELHAGLGESGATACLALCDIDNFKAVNDVHGHDTGDRVLKLIARHLRTALGGAAYVARYGGEEFACLFEGIDPSDVQDRLDAAREDLAARKLVDKDSGQPLPAVTFSAGVAVLGRGGDGVPLSLRDADRALYSAKREGRNRVNIA